MIEILNGLSIPDDEIEFAFSRSGGPGGQNVNKVATRVTLRFDVASSPSLAPEQKARIRSRLASRVSKDGMLRVVSQGSRSQALNRASALGRFVELVREALKREKPRKKTRVPAGVERRRLEMKRRRASVKRDRGEARSHPADD